MKKSIILLITSFISVFGFSQEGTSIIFHNGDTLLNSNIDSKTNKTNYRLLTFKKEGQIRTASPENVLAYWDGSRYFSSTTIDNGEKYFVSQILSGPLKLAEYINDTGITTFLVKLESEEQFRLLDRNQNLGSYFSSFLPSYLEFIKEYKTVLVYTKKSLGEFVSAYNQFINPEKYKFTKFKHESKFYVGVSVLRTYNSFTTDLGSFQSGENTHLGLAISGRINITPSISLMGMLGKTKSDVVLTRSRLIMNSTFLEGHIHFSLIGESKLNILIGPNLALYVNSSSAYEVSRQTPAGFFIDSSSLEAISTGYGFNLIVTYPFPKLSLGGIIGLGGRNINAMENDLIVSGYKGNSKIIRLGVIMEF